MKYDILTIQEKVTTVAFQNGSVTSLKNSDITRYGVRRFENGKLYQTSRIGNATEAQLLEENQQWGGPGITHEYGLAPAHKESRAGVEASSDILKQFEVEAKALSAKYPGFVFTGKCVLTRGSTSLTSNYGLDLHAKGDVCEWHLVYQRKGSGNVFDGFLADASARPDIRKVFEDHEQYLEVHANTAKLESGRMPVILVDGNGMSPLKKLLESIQIDRYHGGSALYSGKLNETLFSPKITLIDRAYDPNRGVLRFFDGEGTVRKQDDYKIIDQGKFAGVLSNLRFANKYGTPSTGNGMRGFNTGVMLSPKNLVFAPGQKSWREIIKNLDRCLVAVITAGGDSNDLGEYSSPVQSGFVFEKGKLIGSAPQVTVKVALSDYLGKNLIDVASDSFYPNAASGAVVSEMDVYLNQ